MNDIEIVWDQLEFVLKHFPILDELYLLKLNQCYTTTFRDIFRDRNDKCLHIFLLDDGEDAYEGLIPDTGVVFRDRAAKRLDLDLLNKASSVGKSKLLFVQVFGMFRGGHPVPIMPTTCRLSTSKVCR